MTSTLEQKIEKSSELPSKPPIAAWIALGLGLAVMFVFVVRKMLYGWFPAWSENLPFMKRLTEGDSYYTHGPLVLLVSGGLLWFLVRRSRIVVKPDVLWGTWAIVISLLLYLAGAAIGTNAIRAMAWIMLLAAIVLRFWGRQALGKLWFPIAFLVFMVPLPTWIISDVNLELKMAVTRWGIGLADLLGVVADHKGTSMIVYPGKPLTVGDVCSGLRTIISLLAFGAAYTYVCRLPEIRGATWANIRERLEGAGAVLLIVFAIAAIVVFVLPLNYSVRLLGLVPLFVAVCAVLYGQGVWRIIVFCMTIPVALAANCLRITSLIVVTDIWNEKIATGAYHDYSGLAVFVLAFLMMFCLEKLIFFVYRTIGKPLPVPPLLGDLLPASRERMRTLLTAGRPGTMSVLSVAGVLLGLAVVWMERPPNPTYQSDHASKALGSAMIVNNVPLSYRDTPMPESVMILLNTRDCLNRQYEGLAQPVNVCLVFSKDNPSSTHPPELCLTANGGEVIIANDIFLTDVPSMKPVPCRELIVQQKQGGGLDYYVYTFKYGKSYTKRFAWQQVWLFFKSRAFGGDASGALIRISSHVSEDKPQEIEAARKRTQDFMRAALPRLNKDLN